MPRIVLHILSLVVTKHAARDGVGVPFHGQRNQGSRRPRGAHKNEPMSVDSKAEGLLSGVVSVLFPLWFLPPVHQSHRHTCRHRLLSPSSWHSHAGPSLHMQPTVPSQQTQLSRQLCPRGPRTHKWRLGQDWSSLLLKSNTNKHAKSPLSGSNGARGSWQPTGIVVIG